MTGQEIRYYCLLSVALSLALVVVMIRAAFWATALVGCF